MSTPDNVTLLLQIISTMQAHASNSQVTPNAVIGVEQGRSPEQQIDVGTYKIYQKTLDTLGVEPVGEVYVTKFNDDGSALAPGTTIEHYALRDAYQAPQLSNAVSGVIAMLLVSASQQYTTFKEFSDHWNSAGVTYRYIKSTCVTRV